MRRRNQNCTILSVLQRCPAYMMDCRLSPPCDHPPQRGLQSAPGQRILHPLPFPLPHLIPVLDACPLVHHRQPSILFTSSPSFARLTSFILFLVHPFLPHLAVFVCPFPVRRFHTGQNLKISSACLA